jgi:hypothetical protein
MTSRDARRSCLASLRAWRCEARHLRMLAIRRHLNAESRTLLLRQADAADVCADGWLTAAIELPADEKETMP